jgi:CheY-like chemotaxis protein
MHSIPTPRADRENGGAHPNQKALIVDDDANIRNLISVVLKREHYDVEQAEDGSEAIDKIATDSGFDIILVDLMMPKVDGLGVIAYLEKNRPETLRHVVVMTAFTRSAVERVGFACPILAKPFDLENLLTVVRERSKPAGRS